MATKSNSYLRTNNDPFKRLRTSEFQKIIKENYQRGFDTAVQQSISAAKETQPIKEMAFVKLSLIQAILPMKLETANEVLKYIQYLESH